MGLDSFTVLALYAVGIAGLVAIAKTRRRNAVRGGPRVRRMRMRSLSESECYARCYGWRDEQVRIMRLEPRRPRNALRPSGEELRRYFEERLDRRSRSRAPKPLSRRGRAARGRARGAWRTARDCGASTSAPRPAGSPNRSPSRNCSRVRSTVRPDGSRFQACRSTRTPSRTTFATRMSPPSSSRISSAVTAHWPRARIRL